MVRDQGHQRLPQRAGVAAHTCRARPLSAGQLTVAGRCSGLAAPTHSRPRGPSPRSGTSVPRGRRRQARAGRWAGRTGSGRRSAHPSSSAGSGLGRREVRGQRGGVQGAESRPGSPRDRRSHLAALPQTPPPLAPAPPCPRGLGARAAPPCCCCVTRLTEVVVTGAVHRVQGVGDVLLDAERLGHVCGAVEEVLSQHHGDTLPGGTGRGRGPGGSTGLALSSDHSGSTPPGTGPTGHGCSARPRPTAPGRGLSEPGGPR